MTNWITVNQTRTNNTFVNIDKESNVRTMVS